MARIRVEGGAVWQWDTGRVVSVGRAGAGVVHFARPGASEALAVEVSGGRAEIPNQLLAEPGPIACWTWDGSRTTASAVIPVVARPKPSDYVYTPTEVETVEALKEWVEERIAEIEGTGGYSVGHGLKVVDGSLCVDAAAVVEADNTLPVTSAAVYTQVGNIEALLGTI